jgi:DNA-binding transcriptional regulator YiaG
MADWHEIEARRKRIGLSRSEMCRRAAISESTVFKGLRNGTRPANTTLAVLKTVLEQAEQEAAA